MYEAILEDSGIEIKIYEHSENAQDAVIYFHGFPGDTPENPGSSDGYLARVFAEVGADLVYFRYRGLGRSLGKFSFDGSLEDGMEVVNHISEKYDRVHFLGRSWGAVVSINAYLATDLSLRGKLLLFSPLIDLGNDIADRKVRCQQLKELLPVTLKDHTIDELVAGGGRAAQIVRLGDPDYLDLLRGLKDLSIIQGSLDEVTPEPLAQAFAESIGKKEDYEVLPIGHDWSKSTLDLVKPYLQNWLRK